MRSAVKYILIMFVVVSIVGCASPTSYEQPNFRIARFQLDSKDRASTLISANVLLEIENRDPKPLPLEGLAVEFKVDDKTLLSGVAPIDREIPGYSLKTVNLSLKSDLISIFNLLRALPAAGKTIDYQLDIEGHLRRSPLKIKKTLHGRWPK